MEGLTEGRIVHFIQENGVHAPAIVVKVWDKDTGLVNLQVFINESWWDVSSGGVYPIFLATSVRYAPIESSLIETNTWHWIEQA